MLKPVDPGPPPPERPVGELVHELIEECKAYAKAEVGLAKAIASAKARAEVALPAALIGVAIIVALGGIGTRRGRSHRARATLIGPLAAGFIGMLLFAGIAGCLDWDGIERLRRDL